MYNPLVPRGGKILETKDKNRAHLIPIRSGLLPTLKEGSPYYSTTTTSISQDEATLGLYKALSAQDHGSLPSPACFILMTAAYVPATKQ